MRGEKVHGWTLGAHILWLSGFTLLFVGFIVLAVVSVSTVTLQWHQWAIVGIVTLSAGVLMVWESRAVLVLLLRRRR